MIDAPGTTSQNKHDAVFEFQLDKSNAFRYSLVYHIYSSLPSKPDAAPASYSSEATPHATSPQASHLNINRIDRFCSANGALLSPRFPKKTVVTLMQPVLIDLLNRRLWKF